MAVFIMNLDMLQFCTFDEKSRVHMHCAAIQQSVKLPFFARSYQYLKICTLNT